jgi:hypothetical protein
MTEHPYASDPPAGTLITLELWAGVLLAPIAWVGHLMTGYGVATAACGASSMVLHAITVGMLLVAGVGALLAWRAGRHLREGPDIDPDRLDRRRFMSTAGLVLSAGFAFVIVMQAVPPFLLRPCE